jgi:GTPase SAR1 family protein
MQAPDIHACICTHAHAYTLTHNEQVTDKESFEHVETWIREIKKFTNDSEVRIVVVGNKIDLASCRQVSDICLVSDQCIF